MKNCFNFIIVLVMAIVAMASYNVTSASGASVSVLSTTPADGAGDVSPDTTIAVTFDTAMNTSTLSAQTAAGACTGSIQVSADDFATCIALTAANPVFTLGDTVATLTLATALSYATIYKVRVTTAAADATGNTLAATYTSVSGFTTATAYSVTYNGNSNTGGSVPTDSASYASGSTVTVLGNSGSLVRTNYTFNGWNTAADGSGTNRAIASTFTMGSANVTLYAQWTSNAVTGSATGLGTTGATLNGAVNAGGLSTTVTFNYGASASYGSTATASQSPLSGSSSRAVFANVAGLTCGATYHFRVTAVNSAGTFTGSDATFSTNPCSGNYNVTISSSASTGGAWSGASPDVWNPTASGSNVSITDIQSRLNAGTGVTISTIVTTGSGSENGDISVSSALTWSNSRLTLTANRHININAVMTAIGPATLDLEPGSGGKLSTGLAYNATTPANSFYGRVDFFQADGATPRSGSGFLTIGGNAYTVITDLGAAGSTTATDLQGINGNLAGYYALGTNIDASATSSWNYDGTHYYLGFAPLGPTTPFTGTFDGLGHVISSLKINRSTAAAGLFNFISSATLRNVVVYNANINGLGGSGLAKISEKSTVYNSGFTGSAGLSGTGSNIGGLVGQNLSGSSISNCFAAGFVFGYQIVGGLVGSNSGTIDNSFSISHINNYASDVEVMFVGGLAGKNTGTISDSYSIAQIFLQGMIGGVTVNYIGGLVGLNSGTITNSYVKSGYNTVGIAGSSIDNIGAFAGSNSGTITNSYWDSDGYSDPHGNITYISFPSGIGGGTTSGATGISETAMKSLSSFSAWGSAIDASGGSSATWRIYDGASFPLLRSLLAPLTVTASDAIKTYDGSAYSGGNGVSFTPFDFDYTKVLGAPAYSGTSQGATAVGSYSIIPGGLYTTQSGYDISFVNGTLTINPPPSYTLTVNFAGDGGNKVESTSPDQNINCLKGSPGSGCNASYVTGTAVTLKATPDWKSTFISWSGDYIGSDNPGTVSVNADMTVTATFDPIYKVRLMPNTSFASIQDAYAGVPSGSLTIRAQAWSFLEDLHFANGTAVTLTGGMDTGYNPTSGYSSVKSLTVGTGSAVIGNITIK
jgi:uncharacterized repeat protein (TIGR02543 family)